MTASEYYELGEEFSRLGKMEDASVCFQRAHELDPTWEKPIWAIGEFLRVQDKDKEAIALFKRAIEVNPEWEKPYWSIGDCLMMQGQYDEAIRSHEKAIIRNPDWEMPYCGIGHCLILKKQHEKAGKFFEKALEKNSQSSEAYNGLGICFTHQGKFELAIEKFKLSINLDQSGNWAEPYNNMADCLKIMGNEKEKQIPNGQMQLLNYKIIPSDFKKMIEDIKSDYEASKKYYYQAIKRKDDYGNPYLGLADLPKWAFSEDEVSGLPYFNRALLLLSPDVVLIDFVNCLNRCFKYDQVLLISDLFRKTGIDNFELIPLSTEINEVIQIINIFQQQFDLWAQNRERPQQSFSLEAIIRFYLGSAISSYNIFNDEMEDTPEHPLSIIDQYYFALTAYNIIEPHQGCIEGISLPLAKEIIATTSVKNKEEWNDRYYAALVMDLANETENALAVLHELKEVGFIPAYLKWAELKRKHFSDDESYMQEIIADMASDYTLTGSSYLYPEIVFATGNEEEMTKAVVPLIHTMENRQVLELIHAWQSKNQLETKDSIFEERYLFARKIIFPHLQEDKLQDYIYNYHPEVHEQVFGSEANPIKLQADIDYYRTLKTFGEDYLAELADKIHKDSFTNYGYAKERSNCPPEKMNYRHYLILVTHLQKEQILKKDEASLLHEYIKYCIEVLNSVSDDPVLEALVGETMEYIKSASLCGISLSDGEKILNYFFNNIKGKQSDLITFQAYREIVTRKVQES